MLEKLIIASEETRVQYYKEALDSISLGVFPDKMDSELGGNKLSTTQYLQEISKKIDGEPGFEGSIKKFEPNEETAEKLIIITKEGYEFDITDDDVKYVAK